MNLITRFVTEEEGADAVEYALVVALIALAIIATATTLGSAISNKFSSAGNAINAASAG